ncbi:MAG: EAL domain-containing protein [Rubrivivax sp.]|nr:EAL domain-containing protein [Rubrivivax sp.]
MHMHDPAEEVVALRAEVAQLRRLANNVPAAIAYYQREGLTCRFANRGYAQMFGFDEEAIVGRTFAQVIGEAAARQIQPQVDLLLHEGRSASYERVIEGGPEGPRYIEVSLLPHPGADGQAVGAYVLITDISRHRRAELALRESEERLAKFMHASAEGIAFHRDGLITDVNPPLLQLLGRSLEDMRGRHTLDFVAPDQRARVAEVMAARPELAYESAVLHADGTRIPVEFIVRSLHYGGELHRMTIVRDLRDRLEARARIDYLAHHDVLTGLPNRAAFTERAQGLLSAAQAAGRTLALLFIDLDHFKRVNDSLGHLAGDSLLGTVARRITGCLRADDLVSRFGGDEFLVLLGGDSPEPVVRTVAHKLLAAVAEPVQLHGASVSVTPSIGVALFPRDGQTPDELIQRADLAMYQAKARGRAGCHFFEPALADSARAGMALESRLSQAVQDNEFVLHFQPQQRLSDGAIVGCEALIRWNRPGHGLVPPDAFIPVAESSRLMLPIGQWVLRQAVREALRWRAAGRAGVPVAVNLSTLQFQAPDFVDALAQMLRDEGAEGALLELELTERMLMDDLPHVRDTLQRLKGLGVRIAVDDFGTGYTSLGHLKDLPIDRLKIDRSFVADLPADRGSAAIAGAIIQMARSMGMQTVAEGVETEAQRDWMAAQGCDDLQGWLLARPMPAEALRDWLAHAG